MEHPSHESQLVDLLDLAIVRVDHVVPERELGETYGHSYSISLTVVNLKVVPSQVFLSFELVVQFVGKLPEVIEATGREEQVDLAVGQYFNPLSEPDDAKTIKHQLEGSEAYQESQHEGNHGLVEPLQDVKVHLSHVHLDTILRLFVFRLLRFNALQ